MYKQYALERNPHIGKEESRSPDLYCACEDPLWVGLLKSKALVSLSGHYANHTTYTAAKIWIYSRLIYLELK